MFPNEKRELLEKLEELPSIKSQIEKLRGQDKLSK